MSTKRRRSSDDTSAAKRARRNSIDGPRAGRRASATTTAASEKEDDQDVSAQPVGDSQPSGQSPLKHSRSDLSPEDQAWSAEVAQTLSSWVIELSADKMDFLRDSAKQEKFKTIISESPERLRIGEVVSALQSFSRTFGSTYQEVSIGRTVTVLMQWTHHLLQLRVKASPGLDPACIRHLLDSVRRFLVSSLADPIGQLRQQPRTRTSQLTERVPNPLSEQGWVALSQLLTCLMSMVQGKALSRWELSPYPGLIACLFILSDTELEFPTPAISYQISRCNEAAEVAFHELLTSSLMTLDDLMESLIERVVILDLPLSIKMPNDKMGPYYGGSSVKVTAPDGCEVHRVIALILSLVSTAALRSASATAINGAKEDDTGSDEKKQDEESQREDVISLGVVRKALNNYGQLPTWPLGHTATEDVARAWALRGLQRRWTRIQAVSRIFATQAFTFLLQILLGSKAAFVTSEAQITVRRRAGLIRGLIEGLASCLSSPWFPTAHALFFAFVDSLARLSFHDSAKTPMIFHMCYMELARDTYTILATLTTQALKAKPLIRQALRELAAGDVHSKGENGLSEVLSNNDVRCVCGFLVDTDERIECHLCRVPAHVQCVSFEAAEWTCDNCILDQKARQGGLRLLTDFASCFDADKSSSEGVRRRVAADGSEAYTASTFPSEGISDSWRLLMTLAGFLSNSRDRRFATTYSHLAPFFAAQHREPQNLQPSDSIESPVPSEVSPDKSMHDQDNIAAKEVEPRKKKVSKKRRRQTVVDESAQEDSKEEGSNGSRSGGSDESDNLMLTWTQCRSDLIKFSLSAIDADVAEASPVDLQSFASSTLWWAAMELSPLKISSKCVSLRRMLNHVLTGKLFATLSNSTSSQVQNVKLGDTLIVSVTEMLCSVPGSPAAEVLDSDLQNLFEEFLRSGRTGPTIRRSLLLSLHKILLRTCDIIWYKPTVESCTERLIALSDAVGLQTSFYPFVKLVKSDERSENMITLGGSVARQKVPEAGDITPKSRESYFRQIRNFIRWLAPIALSREVQNSSLSVRVEAWRLIGDCLFVCPLDSTTRSLLERLLLTLPGEDVASVRRELLSIIHRLFFSQEAYRYLHHLRSLNFVSDLPLSSPAELIAAGEEQDSNFPTSSDSLESSEADSIDPHKWPPIHQYSHLLICLFVVAQRHNVVILNDEGAEIPLLSAVADTPPKARQSTTPMRSRSWLQRDHSFEELSSVLISFFAYCRQLEQSNITKQYQRFALEVVEALGTVSPQAAVQIVPFAAPYIASVPTTSSGVHLTAQICLLLASVLRRDPKILGDANTVRRSAQKNLVRLTRVRGTLSKAAILLLAEVLQRVTGDFGLVIPEIVSKDVAIVAKGTYGNVEAVRQIQLSQTMEGKLEQFNVILGSPIFALRNLETLKHSLSRIGTLVESLDLLSVIESADGVNTDGANSMAGGSAAGENMTPARLTAVGDISPNVTQSLLTMQQISKWLTVSTDVTLLPLPSSGTHFLITLYDLLCDAFLVFAELKTEWQSLQTHCPAGAVQSVEKTLALLDKDFCPAVLGCIACIVSRYREFIGSSRLRTILELSLNGCGELQLAALELMLKALQVPKTSAVQALPTTPAAVTPLNQQMSFGSTPAPTQSRGRLTQPLCRHLPTVAAFLRDAPVDSTLPIIDFASTPPKTTSKSFRTQSRLIALDLFSEVIAQGLISASDLFELVGCCFIAGDKSIEAKTRQLITRILSSAKDPSVVLRRKMPLVILAAFAMFSNRLNHSFESVSNFGGLHTVNYVECFRPMCNWFQDYICLKVSTRAAYTEGLVAALSKLTNFAEVSECLKRSFPSSAAYALPDVMRNGRAVQCADADRILCFVAVYAGFCSALLNSMPWRHLGQLREILLACQRLIDPVKYRLSVDPVGEDGSKSSPESVEGAVDDELPEVYEEGGSASFRSIFRILASSFVALAALHLKRQLWYAYHVSPEVVATMRKRITNRDGEIRPFYFDKHASEFTSASNVVAMVDLVYPMSKYMEDAGRLLEVALRGNMEARREGEGGRHLDEIIKEIEGVLKKTDLVAVEELDIAVEEAHGALETALQEEEDNV